MERVGIIEEIADGKPIQHTRIRVLDLLPHVACANCGEAQLVGRGDPKDLIFLEIDATISASPKDRLAALDLQAKYGLGALKEISVENVRERVRATLDTIRRHAPPEAVEKMLPELRAAWA